MPVVSKWVCLFFNSCFTFLLVVLQVRTDYDKALEEVRDRVEALVAKVSGVDGMQDAQSHTQNLDMHRNEMLRKMLGTANPGQPPNLLHLPQLYPSGFEFNHVQQECPKCLRMYMVSHLKMRLTSVQWTTSRAWQHMLHHDATSASCSVPPSHRFIEAGHSLTVSRESLAALANQNALAIRVLSLLQHMTLSSLCQQ